MKRGLSVASFCNLQILKILRFYHNNYYFLIPVLYILIRLFVINIIIYIFTKLWLAIIACLRVNIKKAAEELPFFLPLLFAYSNSYRPSKTVGRSLQFFLIKGVVHFSSITPSLLHPTPLLSVN
jgi:dolichol kinase